MTTNRWRDGAWAGALVGIAAAALLYGLYALRIASFVPDSIANAMIEWTPGDVATQTIESLGKWGKRLLEIGSVVGFVLLASVLGALFARFVKVSTRRNAMVLGMAMSLLPLALTLVIERIVPANRTTAVSGSWWVETLVYLAMGAAIGWLVVGLRHIQQTATASNTERRAFLLKSGGVALALAAGGSALGWLLPKPSVKQAGALLPTSAPTIQPTATTAPTSAPTATTAVGAPTATAAPPTATPLPAFVPAVGTRPEITAQDSLYLISSSTRDPEINVDTWRLKIHGAVNSPYELSYQELLALPRIDQTSTLECISNEVGNYLIGNCNWNGVMLRDLLNKAGIQDGVVDVKFSAAEGYTESISLQTALLDTTLVVYGIDGQALKVPHGFPARMRIPGKYGEKNVKWITDIELITSDYQGYWQQRGWTDDATIYTTAVIDTGNTRIGSNHLKADNGVVVVGGIGFAGDRGIRQVEIQIDGGAWQTVQLKPTSNDVQWRLWRYEWRGATAGKHTLTVRAVDGKGQPQVETIQDTHPLGATGYHSIEVEVM